MSDSLLISVREAARELGLGRDRCYQLAREGRVRSIRLGRKVLIPRCELEAFITRELEQATPAVGDGT